MTTTTKAPDTAMVVGGTSGIGLASAVALARSGVRRIALVGRNEARGADARQRVSENGAETLFVRGDAGNGAEIPEIVSSAVDFLGSVKVLVNAVSPGGDMAPIERQSAADIEQLLLGVALPPLLMTGAVVPVMRDQGSGGSIINIASDAAKVPTPGESVVGGAMSAIVMFSRTVAMEVKRHQIRVNTLTPSLVLNTGTSARIGDEEFTSKIFERIAAKANLGVPTAEDLAEAVVFLAGSASTKITGQVISVNGGIST
jgi:2-hydroxycyclohexanecarboxyl-CoA dehydrogenase